MSYSGPLEDRIAIRELVETYSDAVFRRDADAWGQTWTQDATWNLMGQEVSGREAIVQMWLGAMDMFEFVAFHALPGAIEVNADRATARVYVSEVLKPKGASVRRVEGEYIDELVKTEGRWQFSKRVYRVVMDDTPA